jgi:TRAP-type mannitol/chloroaromatic compound transport system substrate-binding protein
MDRRSFIKKAGVLAGGGAVAAASLPKPAIAQERYEWDMVMTWPTGFPGLGVGAARFAERVSEMSDGRLQIRLYGAGELVPPFESFDAVTSGTAQIMHATPYYWQGNHPGLNFFTSAPYTMLALEHDAWMHYGGGQELWDELYDQFGLKGWNAGNTGTQMAGWFENEINSVDDLRGLSFRTAGLGGEVWRQVGLNVQTMPAGEIFPSLQSGALDAAEWVGPWNDLALGLHRVRSFYYYPSIIEPSAALEVTVNKSAYESLPADLQLIIQVAAQAENNIVTADFNANNQNALDTLIDEHGVNLRRFPEEVIEAQARASAEVVADLAGRDELTGRIVDSMVAFRENAMQWTATGERAAAEARDLDIQFPA